MFVVPAHGRVDLTRVCLRQLRRTCDTLTRNGLLADAIVIADDENLDTARELGFGPVERPNTPLGRKWNDGYQLACDPEYNPWPADYVVPFGSDDFIDPNLLLTGDLPGPREVRCVRRCAIVSEDGQRLAKLRIPYDGGDGIRVFPTSLFKTLGYRPADEDSRRAIDTSVLTRLKRHTKARVVYHDLHDLQLVDFKSHGQQLNGYQDCQTFRDGPEHDDALDLLADVFPDAIGDLEGFYASRLVAA